MSGERAEVVYQADPATCVAVARKALRDAIAELRRDEPDLGHVEFHLTTMQAWLPSWLESEWDERMAGWITRINEDRDTTRPAGDDPREDEA